MAKQNEKMVCIECRQKLQFKVKYCPFCGRLQDIQLQIPPVESDQISRTLEESSSENKDSIEYENSNEAYIKGKPKSSVVIQHITKKSKKALLGVIITGSSLEIMRTYDRYAFKKDEGIFVRLKYLSNIPNEYLSSEQYQIKLQNDSLASDDEIEEALEPENSVEEVIKPLQLVSTSEPTPLNIPQQKSANFKYITIIFILFLIVIFFTFSGKNNTAEVSSVDEGPQIDPCENVNSEINKLLNAKMPTRALSIIRLNQSECKSNVSFVQLVVSAESRVTSAKEKLALAKEYLQAGNLESAHQTLLTALELDAELVGGVELASQIEAMIQEYNQQQILDEVPTENEIVSVPVESTPQQNANHEFEQAERERAEAQRQSELAQRERQQALEKERQKAEEMARRQNEERLDNQLNKAEKALKSNNYGLAKSLAKEVLSSSSNNAQAKRILRQAEQGEAKVFDEMVIE